ncbi:MAG: DUF4214 domain-containing protein [Pseudomonadota bacterium]
MPTFTGEALFFENPDDENVFTFVGTRDISITIPGDTITLGDDDDDIQVRDLTTDQPIDLEETGVTLFQRDDGSDRGIYLDIEAERDGDDVDGIFNDDADINLLYRVLIDGTELPPLTPGETVPDELAELGFVQVQLDDAPGFTEFNEDEELNLTEVAGLSQNGSPGSGDGGGGEGSVTLETAIEIALFYEVAFGRRADEEGLNFWIDRFEDGQTLEDIAFRFLESNEFETREGAPAADLSDDALVTTFFENGLGRAPAESGFDFWTEVASRPEVSDGELLIEFSINSGARSELLSDNQLVEVSEDEFAFVV